MAGLGPGCTSSDPVNAAPPLMRYLKRASSRDVPVLLRPSRPRCWTIERIPLAFDGGVSTDDYFLRSRAIARIRPV
jgi:hypothetical protein